MGRVFCYVLLLPRALPSADGVCPFRAQVVRSVESGDERIWVVRVLQILILRAVGVKKALLHAIIKRQKLRLSFF